MTEVSALDEMLSVREGVAFCWLGNAGWLIRAEGRLIAFDLDLDPGGIRLEPPPISAEELAPKLDVLFITHEHGDHFNAYTCRTLVEASECLFVVPANNVEKAREIGVPEARIYVARPGEPFDLPGIHVEPQRAFHGHEDFAVLASANMFDCGYLLTTGGKRILQPGDSVLLQDHLTLESVDVLFVSPTVHNTHVDRSVVLIEALDPAHIFPQHFGTYRQNAENEFWTKGYPDELRAALPTPVQERFHKLQQGAVFALQ